MTAVTPLERALRRDRWLVLGPLLLISALCWAWIIPLGRDMYGAMTGPSAWMMTGTWDARHVLLLFAMWTAMMTGMMLPSAAPALLIYGMVIRRSPEGADAPLRVHLFAAGYLIVWTAFGAAATVAQRWLTQVSVLSPMMEARSSLVGAAVVIAAGVYQLTPWKRACLAACQSPAEFIVRHWHTGRDGALRLGLAHGAYCLGCCWALMLLLFVGGVMNVTVIAGLTIYLLIEKLMPRAAHTGAVSGVLLVAWGMWMAVR